MNCSGGVAAAVLALSMAVGLANGGVAGESGLGVDVGDPEEAVLKALGDESGMELAGLRLEGRMAARPGVQLGWA